jgi:hypothetical protein
LKFAQIFKKCSKLEKEIKTKTENKKREIGKPSKNHKKPTKPDKNRIENLKQKIEQDGPRPASSCTHTDVIHPAFGRGIGFAKLEARLRFTK